METNTSVAQKQIGELIDELITLSFKITNGVNVEKSMDRSGDIGHYLIDIGIDKDVMNVLALLSCNAACWYSQDQIMNKENTPKEVAEFAYDAQSMNKDRNKLINIINKNNGIVTEKSY